MMLHCLSLHHLIVLLLMVVTTECTETQRPCEEQEVEQYGAKGQSTFLHCFTTDQETATLNITLYRQEGSESNKLLYPASSLTVEQQRLSLQKDSGKVMFVLHNLSFSDGGQYKCEVHKNQNCLIIKTFFLKIKECKILDPVKAVQNSAVTITCPVFSPHPRSTQVFWEAVYGDRADHIYQCPSSCTSASNNRTANLCSRARTVEDPERGARSLTISPVNSLDAIWYRCTVKAGHVKYCSEVKVIVKDEPPVQLLTKDCKNIGTFKAALNSAFTFTWPVPTSYSGATQVIWWTTEGDKTVPITRCPSPCTSSRAQRPLCERIKTVQGAGNVSLTINPVKSTDALWYWFRVMNATSCNAFMLSFTGNTSPYQTAKVTGGSHAGLIIPEPSENSTEETAEVNNFTVIVTVASTVSVCIFVALLVLLVRARQCFRKWKKKGVRKIKLESQYDAYAEMADKDTFLYSLVQHDPASMCTFKNQ
ncbi:hypothetical protein SRHO_G00279830 [Serrasalmus rhombeus]